MDSEQGSRAVRVEGEVIVLRRWACGTADCEPGPMRSWETNSHGVQQQQLQHEYVSRERTSTQLQDQTTNDQGRGKRQLSKVLEMKRNKPTTGHWTALAMVNVFALIYPISLLRRANSVDENLFATFVLFAAVFLLVVIDSISIVVADVVTDRR